MSEQYDTYTNPLVSRYASKDMVYIFSPASRYGVWRRLWASLAREESKLGLPISEEQLKELDAHLDDIDFEKADQYESETRHDVMAHVRTYGDAAPKAAGIIHLGATSCFITDNADLILNRQGCELLINKLSTLLGVASEFCARTKNIPCLGWTHFQPAQLTTVGKRATLWAQDLLLDLQDLRHYTKHLPFRGAKGTTGTQASFMELFEGDYDKVVQLDENLAKHFSFAKTIGVSGQTYTRKLDEKLLAILSGVASSCSKFANDLRLLMNLRELEEPFQKNQIGSSAMAYKKNPMRAERICSLARLVQAQQAVLTGTVSTQWLERTLDDSACRRIAIPEAFMGVDAILRIYYDIISGLVVHENVIQRRVEEFLPFMATERIIMECVKKGGDRQKAHEAIRIHSLAVRKELDEGTITKNDLLTRLAQDPTFASIKDEIPNWRDANRFVGAAPLQVDHFLKCELQPEIQALESKLSHVSFESLKV